MRKKKRIFGLERGSLLTFVNTSLRLLVSILKYESTQKVLVESGGGVVAV